MMVFSRSIMDVLASVPPGLIKSITSSFSLSHRSRFSFGWLELAAAYLSRGYHFFILCLEPFQPIRPPRARMLGCRFEPAFNVGAAGLFAGPILVLGLAGRVDHSSDVA